MRATSLPTALPVAPAIPLLLVAVLLSPAIPSAAGAGRWLRPVPGEVARSFDYTRAAPFAAGAHRGADLAAPPGAPVRSACAGTVVHAGPVAGQGRVVSVRCGARRVTYLPLARVAVRAGAGIRAGAPIGAVAAGHGGLHLGVRREADRFGYEDPLALIDPRGRPYPAAPPAPRRPTRPAPRSLAPRRPTRPAPRPIPVGRPARTSARVPLPAVPIAGAPPALAPVPGTPIATAPTSIVMAPPRAPLRDVAPVPVWVGLALTLAGVAGSGAVVVRRRRIARPLAAARPPRRRESPA